MADLNRRAAQQAAVARIFGQVHGEQFQNWNLLELQERLRMLDNAYRLFHDEHMNVVENFAEPDALQVHIDNAAIVEENYLDARVTFNARINELENVQRAENVVQPIPQNIPLNNNGNENGNNRQDFRLERITPTIFSGEFSKWKEWRAMYESLIHNNNQLSDTQKFHYLLKSVQASAAQILSGWQAVGENYVEAYNSLIAVFDNNYRIIMAHLEEFQKLPELSTETHESLRTMVDSTNRMIRQLRVAGSPVAHWDHILVHGLIRRMPPRTLNVWETTQDLNEMPPLATVITFLERRARGILNLTANASSSKQSKTGKQPENSAESKKPSTSNGSNVQNVQNSNGKEKAKPSTSGAVCHNCKGGHPLYRCPAFLNLKPEQRKAKVIKLNLCENCFSPQHETGSSKCRYGTCRNCNRNEYHNSALCPYERRVNVATLESAVSNTVARTGAENNNQNFR